MVRTRSLLFNRVGSSPELVCGSRPVTHARAAMAAQVLKLIT